MTNPLSDSSKTENPMYRQRLRQLAHDLRTPLSIISMGVEALKSVRTDAEEFATLVTMIENEGIARLKEALTALTEEPPAEADEPQAP